MTIEINNANDERTYNSYKSTGAILSEQTKPKTLDEQLAVWLKEHNAVIQHFILTPKGERISIDNFIQPGWPLIYTVAQKPNDTNSST